MALKGIFMALISLQILTVAVGAVREETAVGAVREEDKTNHCSSCYFYDKLFHSFRHFYADQCRRIGGERGIIICGPQWHHGYSSIGCNVFTVLANGYCSHDVPTCEKESFFSMATIVKKSCKLAKYAPMIALHYMGFSKAGIVKKSVAAKLMKWLKTVKKNSLFAKIQSYMMKSAYPIKYLDEICESLAEYFSRKQKCEPNSEL